MARPKPPSAPDLSTYPGGASLFDRLLAFCLALAVSALIIFMLLTLGALPPRITAPAMRLISVALEPEKGAAPKRAEAPVPIKRASPRVVPPLPPPVVPPLKMLLLSPEEFAASDISKIHSQPAKTSGDAGAGQGSGTAEGAGEGPGGERLYNAEWYRKPTRAEMATYMPSGISQADWAMIACRTVERYHVDECQELGESPVGSGLARALRLASWQFLVRPPRIGGRTMIGSWVRIRFDFTKDEAN